MKNSLLLLLILYYFTNTKGVFFIINLIRLFNEISYYNICLLYISLIGFYTDYYGIFMSILLILMSYINNNILRLLELFNQLKDNDDLFKILLDKLINIKEIFETKKNNFRDFLNKIQIKYFYLFLINEIICDILFKQIVFILFVIDKFFGNDNINMVKEKISSWYSLYNTITDINNNLKGINVKEIFDNLNIKEIVSSLELNNHLDCQSDNQLNNQLDSQSNNQLDNKLNNQFNNQLNNQLDNQLNEINKIDEQNNINLINNNNNGKRKILDEDFFDSPKNNIINDNKINNNIKNNNNTKNNNKEIIKENKNIKNNKKINDSNELNMIENMMSSFFPQMKNMNLDLNEDLELDENNLGKIISNVQSMLSNNMNSNFRNRKGRK